MPLPSFDTLESLPALDKPGLVAEPTYTALRRWAELVPQVREDVAVVVVDPALADTAALTEAYRLPLEASVNCVVVAGSRAQIPKVAAVCVRADTRADVNNAVRRLLDVRKCSFLPQDRAVAETGMAFGGITPVGLPDGWRILLDAGAVSRGVAIIGSGLRNSKLILPGELLATLPGAEVIDNLAIPPASPA